MKKRSVITMIICIAIPVVVGLISAWLTGDMMKQFADMQKPPLSPPGILFPIVWTILYVMMGIASYRIYASKKEGSARAIIVYIIQLIFNFCWSIVFFNMELYWLAFAWLMIMWLLIIDLVMLSKKIDKLACIMLLPYLLWTTFAAYLNLSIAILN